ncbi:hypothetical protein K437DRAFT_259046 [Tilletiaria anomala UBC 951]|uniref:Urease accessory protein UreF n=1 Tax=Tilletiaria anomala (strain ATCC 24038 / CBS 436.72 / UBC 951) TaxID=1037660 RepID=A0A066VGM4_TILAU|nr:uncharacterized protein K437DRAFT_259046 [Tilletiaria anomala UBC 951]KDN39448.1 hypothetical protein K437DRAFT_259046 [Tilletiaria anomala UBC 951]
MDADGGKDAETYVSWVLSDSNLPTGGFVASAGLEAVYTHGLLDECLRKYGPTAPSSQPAHHGPQAHQAAALLIFIQESLRSYYHLVKTIVRDAHSLLREVTAQSTQASIEQTVAKFLQVDQRAHAQMPNHVNRRASAAQGAALLTLYTKAFSGSSVRQIQGAFDAGADTASIAKDSTVRTHKVSSFLANIKRQVRAGRTYGHLASVWGIFSASLDLSLDRAVDLHLFLQARAVLSSAVRLNILGPYLAHQILLFDVRETLSCIRNKPEDSISDRQRRKASQEVGHTFGGSEWDWSWEDDDTEYVTSTWPLLEIVQGRHDQLHSRLFNS